jgi:hypothetical protein
VCRAADGICDVTESCSGSGPACPADGAAATTVVCRGAAGPCDAVERCTGQSSSCPADAAQPDGTACSDGQFCTDPDTCQGGACAGPARTCNDGNACTGDRCDEIIDQCVNSSAGGQCDDGNPCTDDACGATSCTHTPVVGRACTDGLACTENETCKPDGTCSGGTPRTCPAAANPCVEAVCDENAGGCTTRPADNGRACEDSNPCTGGGTCQDGTCTSSALESCDDGNPCTVDRCAEGGGCEHERAADGTACDNGNDLTADVCRAGVCTDTSCDGAADGTRCDDADGCSDQETCQAGACRPEPDPVCGVELVCPALTNGTCRIRAACTPRGCRATITVRITAPVRSRCRVVLRQRIGSPRNGEPLTQARGRKPKILGVAKGRIAANGTLTLTPQLNKLGRKLLAKDSLGVLEVEGLATVKAPREKTRTRLLPQLIQLVR